MRVVLAQIAPHLGSVSRNLDLHLGTIARARRDKADLLVFPELSLTGYRLRDLVEEVAFDPASAKPFRELQAASRDLDLVVGFVEEKPRERGLFYNAAAYLHKGRVLHVHRKVFLPTAGMFEERRFFAEGRNFRAFDGPFGRTGLLVCRDFLHLNANYLLFADGAEISITVSAAPGRGLRSPTKGFASSRMWELAGEAVSRLQTSFVLYCNRVGFEDGAVFGGGSFIFDPFGKLVAQASCCDAETLVADLDLSLIRKARKAWPFRRDDKPEVTLASLERIVKGYAD
jgi:predicted amidohydrolase